MSENKKEFRSGFRIKWADREIEYYDESGKSVLDVFNKVFEHIKGIPVGVTQFMTPPSAPTPQIGITNKQTLIEGDEYDRIAKDANVAKEDVVKVIKFEKSQDFPDLVPFLPMHPNTTDAVRLVCYAIQVGLQKTPIEVSYLKKILKGPNGYPLPGRELGLILANFRRNDVIIASQTKGKYKPFTLSTKGIEQTRELLKKAIEGKAG
ncbi:MAG: hypothetical protein QXH40_07230 [Candidatus Bathyarchaeia archaeon]